MLCSIRSLCPTALPSAVGFVLAVASGASAQAPTTCTNGPDTFLVAEQCPAPGAAIKVVTSTAGSGPGSLAAAAADAQGGDVVVFAASLVANGSATITLANTLVLDKALTILGPGPGLLTVSGGGAVRVLEVTDTGAVTVSGIRITGGRSSNPTGHGAGIRNGGTLTLQRGHIVGNITQNNTNGAGIANFATLTVVDSLIADNVAGQYRRRTHQLRNCRAPPDDAARKQRRT